MSRQTKSPSLTRDLLMLGDIYVTLAWLAYKRLIHGPLWPWETRAHSRAASVITLVRPEEEAEEISEIAPPKRG